MYHLCPKKVGQCNISKDKPHLPLLPSITKLAIKYLFDFHMFTLFRCAFLSYLFSHFIKVFLWFSKYQNCIVSFSLSAGVAA